MHSDHPVTDYQAVMTDNAQFIDVRGADEVANGTLPGTVNISVNDLPGRLGELDSERRVVVLCRSGGRSTQAAKILTEAGFADVVNLEGGMLAWDNANKGSGSSRSLRSMFGKS